MPGNPPDAAGRRDNVPQNKPGRNSWAGPPPKRGSQDRWLFAVALLAMASPMHAAEIKVLSSNATKTLLEDIAPDVRDAPAGTRSRSASARRSRWPSACEAGEAADLVVITPEAIDQLAKDRARWWPARNIEIARSLIGIAVRRGAPRPDIGTPEALKQDAAGGEVRDLLRLPRPARPAASIPTRCSSGSASPPR